MELKIGELYRYNPGFKEMLFAVTNKREYLCDIPTNSVVMILEVKTQPSDTRYNNIKILYENKVGWLVYVISDDFERLS